MWDPITTELVLYWITHKMAVYNQNTLQEYLNIYQNEFSWFIP